jgi:membrane associated rhomboid family serine protease
MRLSGRRTSSDPRRWSPPQQVVLFSLIGLNLAVYAAQLALQASQPTLIREYLGLSYAGLDRAYAWQFFSGVLLQAGFFSFLGGLLLLYFLGRDIGAILGEKHFLFLYLGGLVAGELGHLFLMPATTVLLGAGGGVAAIVAAYATILPEMELAGPRFLFPIRLKAKHLGYALFALSLLLVMLDRKGIVGHSAWVGGCATGWVYAHLLGFGRPLFLERSLHRRRLALERRRQMSLEEFIAEEIDPVLEKISRAGLGSLTRKERRVLGQAREKMAQRPQ